jgi:hypothetical protein
MSDSVRLSIVGLTGSGKTTYLAALWDALSRSPSPDPLLTLASLPTERQYLTEIHERWLRCDPTPYTRQGQGVTPLRLQLQTRDGAPFELEVPDIAGEAFNELWEKRTWSEDLRQTSEAARGLLVFVHANNIETIHPLVVEEASEEHRAECEESVDPPNPWDPAAAPTQVKLIDLIQAIADADPDRSVLPLAVVLSAWDSVREQGVSPDDFLAMRMPMLAQYLEVNRSFVSRVFGASAMGGDVEDPAELKRLRGVDPSSDRVELVEEGSSDSDITRPLRWLLDTLAR